MKIAQLVVSPRIQVDVVEVAELSDTQRGAGGFGSTGPLAVRLKADTTDTTSAIVERREAASVAVSSASRRPIRSRVSHPHAPRVPRICAPAISSMTSPSSRPAFTCARDGVGQQDPSRRTRSPTARRRSPRPS